jgi:hypothetical protein
VLTSSAGSALVLEGYPGILASSARTVSLWVKTTSQGDLISWGDGLVAGGRFRLWVGNQRISVWPGVVCVHTQDGPPNHCGTDVVTDGEWHHVAAVFAAGGSNVGILIFVDGKLQVETDNTSGVPVNTVAAGDAEVARDLDGAVDDLRIYDRALSVAEVKSLFNGKPCSLPADCDDGNACTTGTCLTSGRCDISPAPCYPNSCEQLWVETGAATDGDYTLYLDNDPARAFQGHCVGMGSVPRTYLSLVHTDNADGATQAVGENFAHTTQAPERTAWYSKVRLNPILPAINVDDRTYTTLLAPAGGETMAYAHAGGCTGFMVDDGRANVDLRGTPFAVATDEYWVSGGWQPYGTTNFPPDPDPGSSPHDDRKVVHITGGGYPGAHGPYPEHSGYNGATLDLRWQPD